MRYLLSMVFLALLLASCQPPSSPISSGVYQSTQIADPGQGLPATPDTTNLFEINLGSSAVQGFHYSCDAGWIKCSPKGTGLPLTGSVSANGAADFSFTYKGTETFGPATVQITGTFRTGGFTGRYKRTASGLSPLEGSITMVWVGSQR